MRNCFCWEIDERTLLSKARLEWGAIQNFDLWIHRPPEHKGNNFRYFRSTARTCVCFCRRGMSFSPSNFFFFYEWAWQKNDESRVPVHVSTYSKYTYNASTSVSIQRKNFHLVQEIQNLEHWVKSKAGFSLPLHHHHYATTYCTQEKVSRKWMAEFVWYLSPSTLYMWRIAWLTCVSYGVEVHHLVTRNSVFLRLEKKHMRRTNPSVTQPRSTLSGGVVHQYKGTRKFWVLIPSNPCKPKCHEPGHWHSRGDVTQRPWPLPPTPVQKTLRVKPKCYAPWYWHRRRDAC